MYGALLFFTSYLFRATFGDNVLSTRMDQTDNLKTLSNDKVFNLFYLSPVLFSQTHLENKNNFYEPFTESKMQESISNKENILGRNKNIFDKLWQSLRGKGKHILDDDVSELDSKLRHLHEILLPGNILVVGNSWLGFELASILSNVTLLSLVFDDDLSRELDKEADSKSVHNLYVLHTGTHMFAKTLNSLKSDPQTLFSNIILSPLTALVSGLLPHEFAKLIGDVLSLGINTVCITSLPPILHSESHFIRSNWPYPDELLSSACHSAGAICKYRGLTLMNQWIDDENTLMGVAVIINKMSKPIAQSTCEKLWKCSKCRLIYGYPATNIMIQTDTRSTLYPTHLSAVSLHTLLKLGLTSSARNRLFMYGLQMKYHPLMSVRSLLVIADHMIFHPIEVYMNILSNEDEKHGMINKIFTKLQLITKQHNENADIWQNHNNILNIQSTPHNDLLLNMTLRSRKSIEMLENFKKLKSMKIDDTNLSNDDIRIMGQYWDREEVQHNPVDYNDQMHLQNLEHAWDRVQTDDKKLDLTMKYKTLKRNSIDDDGDSMLRGDEKELKRAMGNFNSAFKKTNNEWKINDAFEARKENSKHGNYGSFKKEERRIVSRKLLMDEDLVELTHNQNRALSEEIENGNSKPNFKDQTELHYEHQKHDSTGIFHPDKNASSEEMYQASTDEQLIYDYNWPVLQNLILNDFPQSSAIFNTLIYGGGYNSLIALKLARVYQSASILLLVPKLYSKSKLNRLRSLVDSMELKNIVILTWSADIQTTNFVYQQPTMFKYQIISKDIFTNLLVLGLDFLNLLGKLLSASETTILEAPDPRQLILLYEIFDGSNCCDFLIGLIHSAAKLINADVKSIEVLENSSEIPLNGLQYIAVRIKKLKKKVKYKCDGYAWLEMTENEPLKIKQGDVYHHSIDAFHGINLGTLLGLGLNLFSYERSRFFKQYLTLPLYKDMCPSQIYWANSSLWHMDTQSSQIPHKKFDSEGMKMNSVQATIKRLSTELHGYSFSFMDYSGYKGELIQHLAGKYKNSTFIALINKDPIAAENLVNRTINLQNIVVANLSSESGFASKLQASPDFLRYQFIDVYHFLDIIQWSRSKGLLQKHFNHILASGITLFLQVPSPKLLSLASMVFSQSTVSTAHNNENKVHLASQFPGRFLENTTLEIFNELKGFHSSTMTIRTEILKPWRKLNGEVPSWEILRIDIENLSKIVHHHFDYLNDAHTRRYTLKCSSRDKIHYEIGLVRHEDGSAIPYGTLDALSLIALLRMGIDVKTKDIFYDKFLNLALYEDMAPWNIVFRRGKLEYIDFDTKNVTLDKVAPAAFQVIFMLMNYERTVTDFGHCKGHARILYGINNVGRCVESKFTGPCEDSNFPVPCGDNRCKPTYIHCLKDLWQVEKTYQFTKGG